jgi:hypothetical protein
MSTAGVLVGIALIASGCGRDVLPAGNAYGQCYRNGTCNAGLYCDESGICRVPGETYSGCLGASCAEPPERMVLITNFPGGAFWIDIYEASFDGSGVLGSPNQDQDGDGKIADAAVAAAHATSHGLIFDDDGGEEGVELTTVVARSLPLELPASLSFFQAAAACTHAGKRLCTLAEWTWTCENGGASSTYPYGTAYDGGDDVGLDCWTNRLGATGTHLTGTAVNCVTPLGVYDLSGNVGEITGRLDSRLVAPVGGDWSDPPEFSHCRGSHFSYTIDSPSGFRCCRDR